MAVMRVCPWLVLGLASAWGITLFESRAQPPAAPITPKVKALIDQLDDAKFARREQATKELIGLGRAIVPQLQAALILELPAEARRRVENVLEQFRIRVVWYDDRAKFVKRLGKVRIVDFDDIDTAKEDVAALEADRYAKKLGIIITGQKGQFVGRTFGFPKDFPPASAPNMYAPGPRADRDAPKGSGGFRTNVTFTAGGKPAMVEGFGAVFIDADHPEVAPSSLQAFDAAGQPLGDAKVVKGADASQIFCGAVAEDSSGNLVPAIARVHLINGGNWPGLSYGEGVTLDDFVFAEPVASK